MGRKPSDPIRAGMDAVLATSLGRLRYAGPGLVNLSSPLLRRVGERAFETLSAVLENPDPQPVNRWASQLSFWARRRGIPCAEMISALDLLGELLRDWLEGASLPPHLIRAAQAEIDTGWRSLRHAYVEATHLANRKALEQFHRYAVRATAQTSVERIVMLTLAAARRIVGAQAAAITLFSRSGGRTRVRASAPTEVETKRLRSLLHRHFRDGVEDGEGRPQIAVSTQAASLTAPLMRHGRVVGSLVLVGRRGTSTFGPEDVQWANLLADHAAAAVGAAAVRERQQRRATELRNLCELSQRAGFARNNDELARIMLDHLQQAIPHGVFALFLASRTRFELFVRGPRPVAPPLEAELRDRLTQAFRRCSGRDVPAALTSVAQLPPPGLNGQRTPMIETLHPDAICQTPLFAAPGGDGRDEVVGFLLMGGESEHSFRDHQVRFLSELVVHAAESVHRLRVVRFAERRRLEVLFERLHDGVVLLDERNCVVLGNAAGRQRLEILAHCQVGEVLHVVGQRSLAELLERGDGVPPKWEEVALPSPGGGKQILEIVPQRLGTPARPRGTLLLFRDITPRHEAKEAIRRERDFAEVLIATAPAIVLVLDDAGCVVRFNAYVEEITGCRLEDLVGRDWFAAKVAVDDRAGFRRAFRKILEGARLKSYRAALQTCLGGDRDFSWWGNALPKDRQRPGAVVLIGHDLTPLKEAQERALQSERLAAIGQMVAGLGHESRNALQRSQAALERLERRLNGMPDASQFVASIQQAQDHLLYLYEEVRDYAAPLRLRRQFRRLEEPLADAWKNLSIVRKDRDATLTNRGLAVDTSCYIDGLAMQQLFRNLLENSLAACPDPLRIEAAWSVQDRDGSPWVFCVLRDNGPGFTPEARERAFEPFYTTKTRGTGLGMAIVKRIVEAHGGLISVGPPCSKGAEVVVAFPKGVE